MIIKILNLAMPELSICIPSYNYSKYLGDAINSCLSVDYDFELVVLDNCSSDSTPLLREQFEKDDRVKWFRNDEVLPIQKNWNKAISLTTGKYVKLLQADDLLLPNFFQIFVDNLSLIDNYGIIGHLAIMIDEEGNEIRKQVPYGSLPNYNTSNNQAIKLKLRNVARFKEPSCNFFLKEAWTQIGGYSDDLRFVFDIAFNITIAKRFGGLLINEYGACVRRHSTSDGAKLPTALAINDMEKFVQKLLNDLANDCTTSDRRAGNSLIQYRVLEIFLQRFKLAPLESLKFLCFNLKKFKNISSIPITFKILYRKVLHGDVQKSF